MTGADFVLEKRISSDMVGITAVQTKRNHGEDHFCFSNRELRQLDKFSNFCYSAYYLMVDETTNPPTDCFIRIDELKKIIADISRTPSVKISNPKVRKYCRDSNMFYEAFYNCQRGSKCEIDEFISSAFNYVRLTNRVLVGLKTETK